MHKKHVKTGGVGIYLSQSNIQELRHKIENKGGFQIALAPMQPATFSEVKAATDSLCGTLVDYGFSVLVDDRNQRPRNMFKVIDFLEIRHRVVISGRSLSAGVVEYKDLQNDEFVKVAIADCFEFLKQKLV